MENSSAKKAPTGAELLAPTSDSYFVTEVSEEFSLPDYIPEIRRLLTVKTAVLPETRYVSEGQNGSQLEYGGTVTYSLLYTDDEGKLCAVPLSSQYEAKASFLGNGECLFVDTCVENTAPRVTAPRRVLIKTRLKSRLLSLDKRTVKEEIVPGSSAEEMYIERLTEKINGAIINTGELKNIKISDRLTLDGGSIIRPIWCDAYLLLDEAVAGDGFVRARGSVFVSCLCETDTGIKMLTKSAPLAEEIEVEGARSEDAARVTGRCTSLSISGDYDKDKGSLFFDVNSELMATSARNDEYLVARDAYSTKHEGEASYMEATSLALIKNTSSSFSLNESVQRKTRAKSECVCAICDTVIEKQDLRGDSLTVLGKALISLILENSEAEPLERYTVEDYELPFKHTISLGCEVSTPVSRIELSSNIKSVRCDSDRVSISMELYPSYTVLSERKHTLLQKLTLKKDTELENNSSCVRVYFPKGSDTLWEVAKKYHTSRGAIKEANSLDSDSLDGVKNVII